MLNICSAEQSLRASSDRTSKRRVAAVVLAPVLLIAALFAHADIVATDDAAPGVTVAPPRESLLATATVSGRDDVAETTLRSDLLSAFWGRDVAMHATVVVPQGADDGTIAALPVCYDIHGFGGNHKRGFRIGPKLRSEIKGGYPAMVYVFLDASCSMGHHEFADSVNNGPRGRALIEEFIPAIERQFGGVRQPSQRFLTGHSSGGWSVLWLQVTYPEFFGGCWSTSPDPVDFRDWSGVDLYSATNVFRDELGQPRPLVMRGKSVAMTLEEYAQQEHKRGKLDGQMASFDAVFSPRGTDGRPMVMFDRETGAINPDVVAAWKRYDIGLILRKRWNELGPKLKGKLHVWCGDEDTYRLQGAVQLLKADLTALGSDADVLLVPGRNHGSIFAPHDELWPKGMLDRVHREMSAQAKAATEPAR